MSRVVRREVRKRGFLGWIFLLIFLAFNAVMALMTWGYMHAISTGPGSPDPAVDTVARVGAGLVGGTIILWVWLFGAIILGLLVLLTRGGKTVVTEEYR